MIDLNATNKQFIVVGETDTVQLVSDQVRATGKSWTYIVVRRNDGRYSVFRLNELVVQLQRNNATVSSRVLEMQLADVPGLLDASAHEAILTDSMSLERAYEKARTTPGKRLVIVSHAQVAGVLADEVRAATVSAAWLDEATTPATTSREVVPDMAAPLASDPVEETIRLDVATPPTAEVGKSFDLAVRISPPGVEPLAEDGLTKLVSRQGRIFRNASQPLVRYRVRVTATDCTVQPDYQDFLLRSGQESEVLFFQVTAHRDGEISIVVTAQQTDELVAASTRVRLVAGLTALEVAPVQADVMSTFYDTLKTKFNLDDLQDLCFRMAIGWDDLEGISLSSKSRALIDRCRNRGLLAHLVQTARVARPDLAL